MRFESARNWLRRRTCSMRPRRRPITTASSCRSAAARAPTSTTTRTRRARPGFTAPIAGGEQTIAIVAQFLADKFGLRFIRGGRIEVSLTRPVLYGDTLTSHAKIVSIDADRAQLEIDVENQRGEKVLTGTAAVRTNDA